MCRYLGRLPIAQERLTELQGGRLRYEMKKPWRDGTHALVFEPRRPGRGVSPTNEHRTPLRDGAAAGFSHGALPRRTLFTREAP